MFGGEVNRARGTEIAKGRRGGTPLGCVPELKLENLTQREDNIMPSVVSRYVTLAVAVVLSLVVAGGPVMAQAQQSAPSTPGGAMPAPPADRPADKAPTPAEKTPTIGTLEGAVKKVDPAGGTVQVSSGPFGIIGRTLEVTNDTQIQVEGRQGTLADLREGAKVKASYETREGKNIAMQIEVMPAQAGEKSGASQTPGKRY